MASVAITLVEPGLADVRVQKVSRQAQNTLRAMRKHFFAELHDS